jgi:hypothetical protein
MYINRSGSGVLGLRAKDLGIRESVQGEGSGFRVCGLGCGVAIKGFRV